MSLCSLSVLGMAPGPNAMLPPATGLAGCQQLYACAEKTLLKPWCELPACRAQVHCLVRVLCSEDAEEEQHGNEGTELS